jgi:glycogen synthase
MKIFLKESLFSMMKNEKWYDDNDLRTIFFCKGALETVKNLDGLLTLFIAVAG